MATEKRSGRPAGGKASGRKPTKATARKTAARTPKRAATTAAKAAAAKKPRRPAKAEELRTAGTDAPLEAQPETGAADPRWTTGSTGLRLSLDGLILDAADAIVERGELKAVVSVRRGDDLLYRERVNFDWPGGRDKFLRKVARALATAGVAMRITDAVVTEMRDQLRSHGVGQPTT